MTTSETTPTVELRPAEAHHGITARYEVYEGRVFRGRITVWDSGRIFAQGGGFTVEDAADLDDATAKVLDAYRRWIA